LSAARPAIKTRSHSIFFGCPPGADRVAALNQLGASEKIAADVPAYCAEWKLPNDRWRGRVLGPCPRSRLTNQRRISEDEVAVLFEAICHDLESSGFSSSFSASDDVRDQRLMCEMTDRELIGGILESSIDMLVSGRASGPSKTWIKIKNTRAIDGTF
jgi:hypothetical protein